MLQRDVVVVKGTLAHVVSKRFLNSGTRVLENGVASEGEWPVTWFGSPWVGALVVL